MIYIGYYGWGYKNKKTANPRSFLKRLVMAMQLMKVYSPNGEMFEVTPVRAKFLTLQKGWTFSAKPKALFKETSPLAVEAVVESVAAAIEEIKTTTFPEVTKSRKRYQPKGDEDNGA